MDTIGARFSPGAPPLAALLPPQRGGASSPACVGQPHPAAHSVRSEDRIMALLGASARHVRPPSAAPPPQLPAAVAVATPATSATPAERVYRLFQELGACVYVPSQRRHRLEYELSRLEGMPAPAAGGASSPAGGLGAAGATRP